ncbi:hypothetical protein [Klebsiella sp. CN_Kp075]|uniref:hypothetical protein n=1 Tax=Klebsiella sp. CN_Kp075 TaxID=3153413 RepID=UPI0032B4C3CC
MVILAVLTERKFRSSLLISQLLAKAIPVRGANFKKSRRSATSAFLLSTLFCSFASSTDIKHND